MTHSSESIPEQTVAGPVLVFAGPDAWCECARRKVVKALSSALAERERASLALPGGGSPLPLFRTLAGPGGADIDWSRVDIFLGDERCVPADHEDSNGLQIRRELIEPMLGSRPHFYEVEGAATDAEAAAIRYEQQLPARLDLLLGGIGPDGHTASLFPGADSLALRPQRVIAVHGCPKPPPDRITLSPRAHLDARGILMLIRGAEKAQAVAQALEGDWDPAACPAQLMRRGTWILDEAAAAKLNNLGAANAADPLDEGPASDE